MFKITRIGSPNKIRDINIAIAYHNTGRSMKDVGLEYGISSARVRGIHFFQVRHVLQCLDRWECISQASHANHCEEIALYLQQYKNFLEGDNVKIEVTVNDLNGQPGVILSTLDDDGRVFVYSCRDDSDEHDGAEVHIDDLKAALRKLSAK